MKAIQIIEKGKVHTVDISKPVVKPGHILLKVAYVGFCGSDLNTFRGLNPLVDFPIIPGHEIGAIIAELAADVPVAFQVGMHATVNPYTNCGQCPACLNERANACEHNQTLGVQRDGAMAEYLLMPWEKVIVDDQLSLKELALVEPMSVGFHAVERAQVIDNDTVLVFGCGMIGVGVIIRSVLRGAKVIVVDISASKLTLARRLGAQHCINSLTENLHHRISQITGGKGADVVIEAVGRAETYVAAIEEAAYTGRVIYIGYSKQRITFDTQYFVKKELDIRGSRNAKPNDFKAVIAYLKKGNCPIDELISGIYTAEDAQEVLEKWSANPGDIFRLLIQQNL